MSTVLTLILPWPEPELWLNRSSGHNYHAYSSLRKAAKEYAYVETRNKLKSSPAIISNVPVSIVFVRNNKHRYDLDGAHSAMKGALDGIAKALECDDALFYPVCLDKQVDTHLASHVVVTITLP